MIKNLAYKINNKYNLDPKEFISNKPLKDKTRWGKKEIHFGSPSVKRQMKF